MRLRRNWCTRVEHERHILSPPRRPVHRIYVYWHREKRQAQNVPKKKADRSRMREQVRAGVSPGSPTIHLSHLGGQWRAQDMQYEGRRRESKVVRADSRRWNDLAQATQQQVQADEFPGQRQRRRILRLKLGEVTVNCSDHEETIPSMLIGKEGRQQPCTHLKEAGNHAGGEHTRSKVAMFKNDVMLDLCGSARPGTNIGWVKGGQNSKSREIVGSISQVKN